MIRLLTMRNAPRGPFGYSGVPLRAALCLTDQLLNVRTQNQFRGFQTTSISPATDVAVVAFQHPLRNLSPSFYAPRPRYTRRPRKIHKQKQLLRSLRVGILWLLRSEPSPSK